MKYLELKTKNRWPLFAAISGLSLLSLAACSGKKDEPAPSSNAASAPAAIPEIPNFRPLAAPTNLNEAKVLLGRQLFHDPLLSGDETLSCASCHSLDVGGAERKRVSTGIRLQDGPINAPTVLNSSLNFVQFWDGRAATLEEQAAGPVANPIEMGADWPQVVAKLGSNERYREMFASAYPDGVTQTNITHAIAEYERSLITPSRFDQFMRGEASALSEQERRGYDTFRTVGCPTCHQGPGLGGTMYQKMGLVQDYFASRGTPVNDADLGRFNQTHQESDRHRFKVPLLRNIALTAPYFHDGSQTELPNVVRIMGRVQLNRQLTDTQVADIVAFLGSLTGEIPAAARLPAASPNANTPESEANERAQETEERPAARRARGVPAASH